MTVSTAVRVLRERWVLVVAAVLAGIVVASTVSATIPTTYQAKSGVYLTDLRNPPADVPGSSATQLYAERFRPYPRLMTSDRVLGPAAARLGLDGGPDALAGAITVSPADGPTVLTVTATSTSPAQASAIANAVAESFVEAVVATERPPGSTVAPLVAASVVDLASPPTEPTGPPTRANLVLGAVVGLLLSTGWLLARAALDPVVSSPDALRALTGRVVLGVLPRPRRRTRSGEDGTDRHVDLAVRRASTQLTLSVRDARVLVFASALPGDGTTTTVRALARDRARTARVLLVDANLRRPTCAADFGLPENPGLGELVTDGAAVDDVVHDGDGLDVVVAGTIGADPTELLARDRLGEVLGQLRARYDWILVDAPALVSVLDAAVVARHADGVVLVCRERVTTAAALTTALEAVLAADVRVVGSILTAAAAGGRSRNGYESSPTAGPDDPNGTGRRLDVSRGDGRSLVDRAGVHDRGPGAEEVRAG